MLLRTKGIVLRSVKYGEASLITTIFTYESGIQAYLVQGVRSNRSRQSRAGLLQPCTLLEIVVYEKPQKNLQRLQDFQLAHIYTTLQEEVIKNSIALFSVEFLLRLLPESARSPDLFDFCFYYFQSLDVSPLEEVPNFPLFFISQLGNFLGYELKGEYCEQTPHLNWMEGGFSDHPPLLKPFVSEDDAKTLASLLRIKSLDELKHFRINSQARFRLLDWYIEFLHQHTQHLGQIKSLGVLRAILH